LVIFDKLESPFQNLDTLAKARKKMKELLSQFNSELVIRGNSLERSWWF